MVREVPQPVISVKLVLKVPPLVVRESSVKPKSARKPSTTDADLMESFKEHRSRRQSLAEIKKAVKFSTSAESGICF